MKDAALFTARIVREEKWFLASSPEYPEGSGQGLTEGEAVRSLRKSIVLLMENRREEALASLGNGEKLIPLFPTNSKPDDIFDKILAEIGFPKWEDIDDTSNDFIPTEERSTTISQNSNEVGKASSFADSFTIEKPKNGQSQVFKDGHPISHPMSEAEALKEMKFLQGLEFSPMRLRGLAITEAGKRHNLSHEDRSELDFATEDIDELLEGMEPTKRRAFIDKAINHWTEERRTSG